MRSYAMKEKKSYALWFWIVTLICAGMIGAACWFAYTQTANELTVQLETTVGSIQKATEPPQKSEDKPLATRPATEPATERITTTAETQAAALPVTEPATTTAETQPETEPMPEICKPCDGEILQPFSNGELVKSATTGVWQTHNGLDIAASLGDAVYAVSNGVVSQIEDDALWGVSVTIDHKNGVITRYCNLNDGLEVSAGDSVEAGAVIGAIGATADAESGEVSHLHFEVLKDGAYIDPEAFLQ